MDININATLGKEDIEEAVTRYLREFAGYSLGDCDKLKYKSVTDGKFVFELIDNDTKK